MKALLFLAALLLAPAARARAAAGAESFDFLNFDAGVRAAALGGAYTAMAADSTALFYNPAGLGLVKTNEASFMHNGYVEGLTQQYVGLAMRRGWGLAVNHMNFGDIPRTRLDAPDGGLGGAGLSATALSGGYGRALNEWLSVGAGVKLVRESLDGTAAGGPAVDAGVLAAVPRLPGLSLGASLLNAGPRVRFQSRKEDLPLLARAGAAYAFSAGKTENTAAFDLTKERTDKIRYGLGAETVIAKLMAVRLGFTGRYDAGMGITAGVGFAWNAMSVDFAFVPFGDLGSVHRVGLTFRWDGKADSSRAAAGARSEAANLQSIRYNERLGTMAYGERDYAGAKSYFARAILLASNAGVRDTVVDAAHAGMGQCLRAEGNAADAAVVEAGPSPETMLLIRKQLDKQ